MWKEEEEEWAVGVLQLPALSTRSMALGGRREEEREEEEDEDGGWEEEGGGAPLAASSFFFSFSARVA